jgi:hypothetical protein
LRCGAPLVRQAAVLDDKFAANLEQARERDEPGADVTVRIEEIPRFHAGRKLHRLIAENVSVP